MRGSPALTVLILLAAHGQSAQAQMGGFTYQGWLAEGGAPANGSYDFQFGLTDAVTNGNHLGVTLTKAPVPVSNGLFSLSLDFGSAAFDGSGRWLEIGVRTNGSAGTYVLLAPRQPITPSPYAVHASTAQYAETASSVADGGWATNGLVWKSLTVEGPQAQYDWLGLSNGVVAIPAWNDNFSGGLAPGLRFFNTNGSVMGSIESWADHGTLANTPELLIKSMGNIAISPGGSGTKGAWVQLGLSQDDHAEFHFQYDDNPFDTSFNDGLTAYPNGHSKRVGWVARTPAGYAMPGIVGFTGGTTADPSMSPDFPILGELRFYSLVPQWSSTANSFSTYPGHWVGSMKTNGWDLRGKLIQERKVATIRTASYALDFNQSALVDLTAGVTNVTFYTTNATGNPANYESRIFVIRGAGSSLALHWPADWAWLGAGSVSSEPATLSSGQLMRLQLESVGNGESNIIASAQVAIDNSVGWDTDAAGFFIRAAITDPIQKLAVNRLVLDLKAGNVWSLHYAIYPFVGGSASSHAQNLKSGAYPISWTAATHSTNGVGFDGSTAFGDTTYNIAAAGVTNSAVTNSFHTFVYCQQGTNWLSTYPLACPIGAADFNTRLGIIKSASQQLRLHGFNNSLDFSAGLDLGNNDERGPIMATRTAANSETFYFRALEAGDSTASSGVPNSKLYIGARSFQNAMEKPCATTLAGASFGSGMSSAQWDICRLAWENFEAALARNAP